MSGDEIYYRIGFDGEISICELQWFDESGYDADFWITEKTFDSKAEAIAFLKSKVLPDNVLLAIKNFLSAHDTLKFKL